MASDRPFLVFSAPGTVPRLPVHIGAWKAWHDSGLPKPDAIVGQSAGAIAAALCVKWDEETFRRVIEMAYDMTPGDVFGFPRRMKVEALSLVGASAMLGGLIVLLDGRLTKKEMMAFGIAAAGTLLTLEGLTGRDLIMSRSLFTNDPLRDFLLKNLDFGAIFSSHTLLEIIATDMSVPKMVVFSNKDGKVSDSADPEHRKRFVQYLLASGRLSGWFSSIPLDGSMLGDGEIWTDLPLERLTQYRRVVRFDYWTSPRTVPAPEVWMADVDRTFGIVRDLRTNIECERYALERILEPGLPEIFSVRAGDELLKKMSWFRMYNFKKDDIMRAMNFGYLTVMENLPRIRKYLE